ncbi:hypothetical protein PHBOTO_003110 [Pseudozyma hubeiensis]|nr:hypothetical protein PHBOTO_003110 [Pseudozyma hubeiensis]
MSKLLRNGIPRKEDGKIDFSWKNHYGFTGFIVLCGFLFPPLAVAVRFGIGKDFFINVLLTICAIIPGHIHNWFIQNIRNNDTQARTPKWAIRYGLVDDRPAKKLAKKRQWTGRFHDRVPQRVVYDDEGRAHVVEEEEVETREDHMIAPWNVHPNRVKEHKTGLVEPDQWINEDPERETTSYAEPQSAAKQSRLSRFRHRSNADTDDVEYSTNQGARRYSSSRSSTSSLSIVTPEDATRSSYTPSQGRRGSSVAGDRYKSQPSAIAAPAYATESSSNSTAARRTDDIFAHEF